jgi:glycerol-3-phosphate cytidylyltransferase-like family protein
MEVLAALACVDYVIEFKEETADKILQALQPQIYAKGTDYTERSVPERETVKAIGAKVAIVGDKKSHSTEQDRALDPEAQVRGQQQSLRALSVRRASMKMGPRRIGRSRC